MYLPDAFTEDDPDVALAVMREHPFATVITASPGISISQVPTVVHADGGDVVVRLHLSARNPQCVELEAGRTCVVLFSGPGCYVSPSWYAEHPNVPTWNYLSVELRCEARRMTRDELDELVRDQSKTHEASVGGVWDYSALPGDLRDELLEEIAGFRLEAQWVQCKCKLSQNRTAGDRASVVRELGASNDVVARAVARWMTRLERPRAGRA